MSDVDLAILFAPGVSEPQRRKLTLDYLAAVNRRSNTDEVNFVVLNEAPLTMRHAVVADGRVLADNDSDFRRCFEVHTEDLYMDFKPALRAYGDELLCPLETGE